MATPDSIEMVWSTGFAGVALRLGGDADSLAGVATSFFDYREGHETRATATRIDCEAPIPDAWKAARRFSVGVPLASRDTLRVGTPLPAGVALERDGSSRSRVIGVPTGSFIGADSIQVDLNGDRLITYMVVFFPDTLGVERLAGRVEALLGPPTYARSTNTIGGRPAESVGWTDRYDAVHLSGTENLSISMMPRRRPR